MEKEAFQELEEAMIKASLPKKERLHIVNGISNDG